MAIFNPQNPDVQTPQFLRYSSLSGSAPGGGALNTIASVLPGLAKSADAIIDKSVETQVGAAVDKVQALYGVDAASPAANDTSLPPNLKSGMAKLDALYQGYQNGSIKESHMYGLLNSYVKQIKANNPGYEDNVDKWMESKGYRPANQLVASLRQEALQGLSQRNAAAKDRLDFEEAHTGEITAVYGDDYWTNPDKRNMPMDQLLKGVSQFTATKADTELQSALLTEKIKRGEATKQDYEVTARKIAGNYSATVTRGLGDDFENKILAYQKSGQIVPPEELQQITATFAAKKAEMQKGLIDALSNDKNQTWYNLDEPTRKDILASATAGLDVLQDTITNKEYGLTAVAANLVKAQTDQSAAGLLGNPLIKRFAAVKNLLGDAGAGILIAQPGNMDALSKAVVSGMTIGAIDGKDSTGTPVEKSLKTDFEDISKAKKQGARLDDKTYKAVIDTNAALLKEPSIAPEVKARIIQYMFGPNNDGFMQLFDNDKLAKVYGNLVNPEMTKTIASLAEKDPQLWKNYSTWSYRAFQAVGQQLGSEIKQSPGSFLDAFTLRYNKARGQLEATPNGRRTSADQDPLDQATMNGIVMQRVTDLNTLLSSIKPVTDKEGLDLGIVAKQVLNNAGLQILTNDDERGSQSDNALKGSPKKDELKALDTSSFLNFIGQSEGASYNTMYGEQQDSPQYNLSNMTVNEVMNLQREVGGSGAAGKFQIQRATLSYLKKEMGLSGDEFFTPDMQDQMANTLLQRRGLNAFTAGDMGKEQFANELSKEWASLPSRNGASYYQGIAGNKATTDLESLYEAITNMGVSDQSMVPSPPLIEQMDRMDQLEKTKNKGPGEPKQNPVATNGIRG